MGFMRGLSAEYMEATPAINDWLADLVDGDPVLKRPGFDDPAGAGRHRLPPPAYEAADRPGLAVPEDAGRPVAREPGARARPGEQLATMASLLHVDRDGRLAARRRSSALGLAPAEWLRALPGRLPRAAAALPLRATTWRSCRTART